MAKIVQSLRQDHINMARILDALERQLVVFDEARKPDYEMIQAIIDYCLNYPDLHHHPTEDLILEKLAQHGAASEDFRDLRRDHERLSDLTRRFATTVLDILREAEMPRESFQKTAREFLEFYRHHINKEEMSFFPTALKLLSDEDWAEITEKLEHREDPVFGSKADARFEALREDILHWDG